MRQAHDVTVNDHVEHLCHDQEDDVQARYLGYDCHERHKEQTSRQEEHMEVLGVGVAVDRQLVEEDAELLERLALLQLRLLSRNKHCQENDVASKHDVDGPALVVVARLVRDRIRVRLQTQVQVRYGYRHYDAVVERALHDGLLDLLESFHEAFDSAQQVDHADDEEEQDECHEVELQVLENAVALDSS